MNSISDRSRLRLEAHLREKIDNHSWLNKCLSGKKEKFPYRPSEGGQATISKYIYQPNSPSKTLPQVPEGTSPLYLANIPLAHLPSETDYEKFKSLVTLFKTESFGKTATQSKAKVIERLAMVIGINQIRSLDPSVNRSFEDYLANVPTIKGIACRAIGFFWEPIWEKRDGLKGKIYPVQKAFMVLKALSGVRAKIVREAYEVSDQGLNKDIISQIPFQQIRETIKNSADTLYFSKYFQEHSQAVIYYGVMDADCQKLRTTKGLFSRLDKLATKHDNPSAISLGYSVGEDERPLIRLGVKIDMKVREAMNSVFGFGPYFPEPGSFFRVREPEGFLKLKKLSFLGAGRGLENRRLIQSGLKSKVLSDDAIFVADGGVMTGTPGRMKTIKNGRIEELTPQKLKQKQYLKALRDVSQTHATPKQWADILYCALGFSSGKVTNVTQHMMHIFSVFDPISRMFARIGRFSSKGFDEIMDNYDEPLSKGLKSTLKSARLELSKLNMKKGLIDKIEEAARRSGKAIYNQLTEALS